LEEEKCANNYKPIRLSWNFASMVSKSIKDELRNSLKISQLGFRNQEQMR